MYISATALARTAFLIFRRRPATSALLTYPHVPAYPLNLLTLVGLKSRYRDSPPWTLLKSSKNL